MGLFEQFPYQNFHELNLDWLINEIKNLEANGMVLSVNGMTGDVILYEENIVRLPDVGDASWNIFRKNDGQDNGIEFTKNQPMTRIQGSSRFAVYDAGNPPPYPVTSVNGATGDVTLYPNNVTQLPSVANTSWNIYRITDGQENGIEWTKNQPMTRIQGTSRFTVYDTGNPPPNFADTSAPDLQLPVDTTGTSWSINRNIGSGNLGLLLGVTGGQEEAYIQYDDGVTPSLVKLLTPADIPSSSGVVSFNGQTGVVTADASNLEMSSSDSTTIEDTITNIENDIAILINGSTAAVNVAAGQYVLVQNSGMTGVQDGLYISNTAVPAGTPFTSAYLDAVTNGGLNWLNANIAKHTSNANGNAWQFDSGLMICTKTVSASMACTSAWGQLFESTAAMSFGSWPVSFVGTPNVTANVTGGLLAGWIEQIKNVSNTSAGESLIVRPTSATNTCTVDIVGVGMWK